MKKVTEKIYCVGVNDKNVDLFEGQYVVKNGMSYNSYVIVDEKIAVMDTVEKDFGEKWLENVKEVLSGRKPDYLVVLHMEPDHSANIGLFLKEYPEVTVVGNDKTFTMISEFFGDMPIKNKLSLKDGETLSLGARTLRFINAPMVHWPEVMFCYDEEDKILFSADAFGKFGAVEGDDIDLNDWKEEGRRYYIGIVGKFGVQVQNVLKKAAALDIQTICPLHGPVLKENLEFYLNLYNTWSSYVAEEDGVLIAYTSVYGHTKQAAEILKNELDALGVKAVLRDLARSDMSVAVAEAFKYSAVVFATTTYNGDIFPFMRDFIERITERNFKKRTVAFIENGSWAPMAKRVMTCMFECSKDLVVCENSVTVRSALTEENKLTLSALANELKEKISR